VTGEAPLEPPKARDDATSWATPTGALRVGDMPAGAVNRNVAGRRLVGPVQGFGQLWQKTYRIRLYRDDLTPAEVISEWKANYASYWPKGNRFYAPSAGIQPGGVALINAASLGGVQVGEVAGWLPPSWRGEGQLTWVRTFGGGLGEIDGHDGPSISGASRAASAARPARARAARTAAPRARAPRRARRSTAR